MAQPVMVLGSILLGVGAVLGVIVWINRLTACDPFDPSETC